MNARKTAILAGVAGSIMTVGGIEQAAAGIDAGGTSSTSKGTITALGGVHVNGVHFNTDGAHFVVNGQAGTETDLEVGKVVTVLGTIDAGGESGAALAVVYTPIVKGPVDRIDLANGQITVLGQTVLITADTNYAIDDPEGLAAGANVEVSGYRDGQGQIFASYVGPAANDAGQSIDGIVTASDPATMIVAINGLEIDYSQAYAIDVPGGMPEVGQRLEIAGTVNPETGRLHADMVAIEVEGIDAGGVSWQIDGIDAGGIDGIDAGGVDGIDAGGVDGIDAGGVDGIDAGGLDGIDAGGMSADIEGHVEALPDAQSITVNGMQFVLDSNTQFIDGDSNSLALNTKVEVEGTATADGVIVADRIEFERYGEISLSGYVESAQGNDIIIDGIGLRLTDETSYHDQSAAGDHEFNALSLYTGDAVEVYGYESGDDFIVTRIDRHDSVDPNGAAGSSDD